MLMFGGLLKCPIFECRSRTINFFFRHVFKMDENYSKLNCDNDFSLDLLDTILDEAENFQRMN